MAWLGDWAYRKRVKINGLLFSEDVAYYPVMLRIDDGAGRNGADLTAIFTELTTNDKKIAVTLEDGVTQLTVEIARWDDTNDIATLWVVLPSITAGESVYLYLYYDSAQSDNTGYVGDVGDTICKAMWATTPYIAALHLVATMAAGDELMESVVGRTFSNHGGLTEVTDAHKEAPSGYACEWSGGGDDRGYNTTLVATLQALTDDITVEFFHYPHSTGEGGFGRMFEMDGDLSMYTQGVNIAVRIEGVGSNYNHTSQGMVSRLNDWNHHAFTRKKSTTTTAFYQNGAAFTDSIADDGTDLTFTSARIDLGNAYRSGAWDRTYDGLIAEMRISDEALSAGWEITNYYNYMDQLVSWYADDVEESLVAQWLGTWANRIAFTIDSSKIDSDLTDFPLCLHIDNGVGQGNTDLNDFFTKLSTWANRKKIAVTDEDGLTQLPVEIDTFDTVTPGGRLHVKVPTIPSTRNKKIYLYYDSAQDDNPMVGDIGDAIAQTVWDDDFLAVYHFSDGIITASADSTANGNDADDNNTELGAYNTRLGKFKIIQTTSPDIKIELTDATAFRGLAQITVDILAKINTEVDWGKLVDYASDVSQNADRKYRMFLNNAGTRQLTMTLYNSSGSTLGTHTRSDYTFEAWQLFSLSYDGAAYRTHIDGVKSETTGLSGSMNNANAGDIVFGRDNYNNLYQAGIAYDEVRISKTGRSDAWQKATYYSSFDLLLTAQTPQALSAQEEFNWLADDSDVPWGYRIPIIIDHTKVDSNLSDFPLAVQLSDSSGINGMDATHFFNEMDIPQSVSDGFTGTNGDALNKALWGIRSGENPLTIQSNAAYGQASSGDTTYRSKSTFLLSGDFDIQTDFTMLTHPETDRWFVTFGVWDEAEVNRVYLHREYHVGSGGPGNGYSHVDVPGYTYTHTGALDDLTGKLRMVRSGSTITTFYWNGTVWVLIKATTVAGYANDMNVFLTVNCSIGDPTVAASFDNFTVTTGTVLWPVSEYGQGRRVAFTLADGTTRLYAELERISITDAEAVYHVKIPSLSSVVDTLIYMYYDAGMGEDTTYIGDVYDRGSENVWDYVVDAVFHPYKEPVTDDPILDSTAGGYTLTPKGTWASGSVVNAEGLNKAVDFDGTTNYMELDLIPDVGSAGRLFEIMFDAANTLTHCLFDYGKNLPGERFTIIAKADQIAVAVKGHTWGVGSLSLTGYHWLSVKVITGATDSEDIEIWLDGVKQTCTTQTGSVQTLNTVDDLTPTVGANAVGFTQYFDGGIGEIRIAGTARSESWIEATAASVYSDNLAFYSAVEAWLKDYDKRIRVVVDSTKIDAVLTDFPLAIVLDTNNAPELFTELATGAGPYANLAHPNRKKIRVATLGGESLNTELNWTDIENDLLGMYTKIPSLPADKDTVLFVYFDNTADDAGEVGDIGSAAGQMVWDGDHGGVYHLTQPEKTGANTFLDSTDNDRHGSMSGDFVESDTGISGGIVSTNFDGVSDAKITLDEMYAAATIMTLMAFVKPNAHADFGFAAELYDTAIDRVRIGVNSSEQVAIYSEVADASVGVVGAVDLTGAYHLLTLVRDGTNLKAYVDGVQIGTSQACTHDNANMVGTPQLFIGAEDTIYYFDGKIAEVRISAVARSEAWIKATYYALGLDLLSFAYEIASPPLALVFNVAVNDSWEQSTAIKIAISGAWKTVTDAKLAIGGAWKDMAAP